MSDSGEHVSGEDLLLLLSGELCGPAAAVAKRHLRGCAPCRHRLADYGPALEELRRAIEAEDRQVFQHKLNAAAAERRSVRIRDMGRMTAAGTAAACLVAGLLFFWNERVHAAGASKVLDEAVRIEQRVQDAPSRSRVRIYSGGASCASFDDACSTLLRELQAARWDTNRPLSASAFRRWRDTLTLPYDRVTRTGHEVEISTTAVGGPIRNVRLRLDAGTLRARAARIVRPGALPAIDIVEAADAPPTTPYVAAAPSPAPAPPAIAAGVERAVEHSTAAAHAREPLLEAEILARLRLHGVRADEGYETIVRRVGGEVTVFGLFESVERKAAVFDALSGLEGVRADLKTFGEAQTGDDAPFGLREKAGSLPRLAGEWLERRFPVFEERTQFVNRVSELAGTLAGLAKTREEVSALVHEAAQQAIPLSGDLARVLHDLEGRTAATAGELAALLEPVIGPAHVSAPVTYEAARAIDSAVTRLFMGNNDTGADIESELTRLRTALR